MFSLLSLTPHIGLSNPPIRTLRILFFLPPRHLQHTTRPATLRASCQLFLLFGEPSTNFSNSSTRTKKNIQLNEERRSMHIVHQCKRMKLSNDSRTASMPVNTHTTVEQGQTAAEQPTAMDCCYMQDASSDCGALLTFQHCDVPTFTLCNPLPYTSPVAVTCLNHPHGKPSVWENAVDEHEFAPQTIADSFSITTDDTDRMELCVPDFAQQLPLDVSAEILSYLGEDDLLNASLSCTRWNSISHTIVLQR